MKNNRGITLIALIITIIVLLILAGVTINAIDNTNLIAKSDNAAETSKKKMAEEIMNLKITNIQISKYVEKQKMPTLQELADELCDDNEMEYVLTKSKNVASLGKLDKIQVGEANSIFTKLKAYPYEFEINSSLQLASIDGIKVSSDTNPDNWNSKNTWEKLEDIGFTLDEIVNNEVVFNKTLIKQEDILYMLNNTDKIMPSVVNSQTAMKIIGNNKNIYKYIFGDTDEKIDVNSTWVSAILNNANALEALDQTTPITVPNMTSNTTPYGVVSASSSAEDKGAYPWKGFNSSMSSHKDSWVDEIGGENLPAWLCYKFEQPVLIYQFSLQNRSNNGSTWISAPYDFSIQASNDGVNWDTIGEYNNTNNTPLYVKKYAIQNINKRYYYYRIYVTSAMGNTNDVQKADVAIGRLQFYGK